MNMNITASVYNGLRDAALEIAPKVQKAKKLESDAESGVYTDKVSREKRQEAQTLRNGIRRDAESVYDKVCAEIDAVVEDMRRRNDLRPEDLTEDVKLLNCGVKLTERDIAVMFARNAGNRTMQQIIQRYARENGIHTNSVYDNGLNDVPAVEGMKYTAKLFAGNWIDKDNALQMLDKFFGVQP